MLPSTSTHVDVILRLVIKFLFALHTT